MEASESVRSGFSAVDDSEDPARYVAAVNRRATAPGYAAYKADLHSRLGITPGETVLDLGCGAGVDLPALASAAGHLGQVVGLDYSMHMCRAASEYARVASADPHASELLSRSAVGLVRASGAALPLRSESMDAIVCDRVLQHVSDPPAVMHELARVLAVGGRVAIADPDQDAIVVHLGLTEADRGLARKVQGWRAERGIASGWVAQAVSELALEAGLRVHQLLAYPIVARTLGSARQLTNVDAWGELALRDGVLTDAEAEAWRSALLALDARGATNILVTVRAAILSR